MPSVASPFRAPRLRLADVLTAAGLFAAAFAIAFAGSGWMGPTPLLADQQDVWLQGDQARVVAQMTSRFADGGYTFNHPFFPVITHPPTWVLNTIGGLPESTAVRIVTAAALGIWIVLLFAVVRRLRVGVADAVLVCAAGLAAAGFLFWAVTIEVFLFSASALLVALLVSQPGERRDVSDRALVASGIVTLGLTVTNWMATAVTIALTRSPRRGLHIVAYTVALASVLWAVERRVYENVQYFFDRPSHSYNFVQAPTPSRIATVSMVALLHTAVAPEVLVCNNRPPARPHYLSMQQARPFTNGVDGGVATVAWILLLILGGWGAYRSAERSLARNVLGLTIAGQFALHWVFGGETFLYAMHFLSVLLPLVAYGLTDRFRWGARVALLVFVAGAASANVRELRRAATIFSPDASVAFRNDQQICRR